MMSKHDTELLAKLNAAVKSANAAEQTAATAQAELASRSKAVGLLLLEAKKLHPKVKDFKAFLKKVHGLKLSRAYDLLRLASGRTTEAELKRENRERKQKSRANKTLPVYETVTEEPMPVLRQFTAHVLRLQLMTRNAEPAKFAAAMVKAADLVELGNFLSLVAAARKPAEEQRSKAA
jgi:hypothetical protein